MTTRPRFDKTLRAVMWTDAFFSVGIVLVSILAVPLLVTVGVPDSLRTALVVALLVAAVILGGCGPVYAVLLMLRMGDGDYLLPKDMRVPLPYWLRPSPLRSAWTRR